MTSLAAGVRRIGAGTLRAISRVGFATRFFGAVLLHTPSAIRRLQLTAREVYFAGVLSLVVIMVSGLFVGMVLGLQGYDVLVKYGAGDSLGIFVGLSLVRELGPVVAGLLFYRQFDWKRVVPMLVETAQLSGAILFIIGTATAMAWALSKTGSPWPPLSV